MKFVDLPESLPSFRCKSEHPAKINCKNVLHKAIKRVKAALILILPPGNL
jgi:hypothetical protein